MKWKLSTYSYTLRFNDGSRMMATIEAPRRHEARTWALDDHAWMVKAYGLKHIELQLLRYANKRARWAGKPARSPNPRSFYLPK